MTNVSCPGATEWIAFILKSSFKLDKNKKRSLKKRTRDLWNTRRETQIQTKLDQPPWENGQHQTAETRPQLQTSRKKGPWTPQETKAMRRCRNRSNELIHGGRWWWWWSSFKIVMNIWYFILEILTRIMLNMCVFTAVRYLTFRRRNYFFNFSKSFI